MLDSFDVVRKISGILFLYEKLKKVMMNWALKIVTNIVVIFYE